MCVAVAAFAVEFVEFSLAGDEHTISEHCLNKQCLNAVVKHIEAKF